MKGAIWVHVLDDLGNNVKGPKALKDGGSEKPANKDGLATYDPWKQVRIRFRWRN